MVLQNLTLGMQCRLNHKGHHSKLVWGHADRARGAASPAETHHHAALAGRRLNEGKSRNSVALEVFVLKICWPTWIKSNVRKAPQKKCALEKHAFAVSGNSYNGL